MILCLRNLLLVFFCSRRSQKSTLDWRLCIRINNNRLMLKANTKLIFFFLLFSSVSHLILTCRNYADYSAYYGILLTQSINILDVKSIKMFALQRQKKKEIEGSGAKQTFTETLSRPLQIWINSGTEHMFVHYTPVLSYSRTHKEVTTKIFLNTDNRLIRTYSAEILFITRHCCS